MITMEKLISSTNEGTDILADSIISLMKKAYECDMKRDMLQGTANAEACSQTMSSTQHSETDSRKDIPEDSKTDTTRPAWS